MTTYRATGAVTLSIPNKLKANGVPAANAVWRNVVIPASSRFTHYSGSAMPYLASLCNAQPNLVKET